jgi:hypothetical protein
MLQSNKEVVASADFIEYENRADPRGGRPNWMSLRERVQSYREDQHRTETRTIRGQYKKAKAANVKFITDINDPRLAWILNEVEKLAKANDFCDEFETVLAMFQGPKADRNFDWN